VAAVSVVTQPVLTRTRDRLVNFVISSDGVLIALYNDVLGAVIKLKDVSGDDFTDWRLSIRPEVCLHSIMHQNGSYLSRRGLFALPTIVTDNDLLF